MSARAVRCPGGEPHPDDQGHDRPQSSCRIAGCEPDRVGTRVPIVDLTASEQADALGGVDAAVGTLEQYAHLGPLHRGRSLHGAWASTDLMLPEPRGVVVALTP